MNPNEANDDENVNRMIDDEAEAVMNDEAVEMVYVPLNQMKAMSAQHAIMLEGLRGALSLLNAKKKCEAKRKIEHSLNTLGLLAEAVPCPWGG